MVTDFYLSQRFDSPQFLKCESLISFYAQSDYGSELGDNCHNKICKPALIPISQESAHTTGLLEQYLQNIALFHLTQIAYHLTTKTFLKLTVNYIRYDET